MSKWYLESKWSRRKFQRDLVYESVREGKRILDVGYGIGRTLRTLNKTGKFIVGIDLRRELIKESRKINKNINYILADATMLPFKESVFNIIILENVIEHIADQKKLVKGVHYSLKRGGKCIVSTPNKYIYRVLMYLGKIKKMEFDRTWLSNPVPDHIAELTPKSIKKLFSIFSSVNVMSINPYIKTRKPELGIEMLVEAIK